jgi:hypothetical protein
MRGLPFPSNATFDRETSYADYGTPLTNVDDIPIDPALGGPAIDPAIMGETAVEANVQVNARSKGTCNIHNRIASRLHYI